MGKLPNNQDQFLPESASQKKNNLQIEKIHIFQEILATRGNKGGKLVTRLRNNDLHESDIIQLKFSRNGNENGQHIKASLMVQGVHGTLLFCMAKIHKTEASEFQIGTCTVRLPMISRTDSGILGRRSFDNLVHELGHALTQQEKEMLTEASLDEMTWIPNYQGRIQKIGTNIKKWVRDLF